MRKVFFVTAILLASIVPAGASQQAPAQAPAQVPPPSLPQTAPPPSTPRPGVTGLPAPPSGVGTPAPAQTPAGPRGAAPTPRPGGTPGGYVPAAPTAPAAMSQATSWQNIKVEVAISDSLYADVQSKKTVSMIILDGRAGQVRSTGGDGLINVDARPAVRPDGRIYLQLSVEYRPELTNQQSQQVRTAQPGEALRITTFSESLALIVSDGKPILASQSADPRSDRKVSLEVTATVVK